jgi:DNA-binding NarL/FixJ family response regulator
MCKETTRRKILLVDDHPLLLEGLARLISAEAGLGVCGMAGSVRDALALVESLKPDLVITDLTLPGRNGLEFIKDLAATHPEIPVIVLSMHDEMIYAERVLRAGGRGYVMKDTPPARLLEAIRIVLGGGVFASQTVTNHFLKALANHKAASRPGFPMECLTDREMEVFELIGHAKSNHEIATQLGISPRTLDAHRAHIREKLGLTDSNELTRHAIRWIEVGMIEP